ncbi:hypothetical protein O1611_g3273 [Lasiodiplodia mahajangana]|uniref:Uncharacterized protein n=1 Tax=Lasiodiplodia mahajangana TaxID=1108764 RepID=A0ACC2JT42_9PEZI|nr:hypothetical protein O1611_g3273 [Lasiodiplodia mahajangana]
MSQSSQPQVYDWLQHKRAVEKLLLGAKERNILSTLYLYGPPTSGLNSSLVDYVIQQVKGGLAPKQIVYIAGTDLDEALIAARLSVSRHVGKNQYDDTITIKSAQNLCDDFEAGKMSMGDNMVLMIEVRMSATVAEEVMFGIVLGHLRELIRVKEKENGTGAHIAVLLLGSSWFSERTFRSFEKLMQTEKRSIQDTRPIANFSNPDPETQNQILEQALSRGQRILFSMFSDRKPWEAFGQIAAYRDGNGEPLPLPILPSPRTPETAEHASDDLQHIRNTLCFQVDPRSLFSTSTNLSIVVSSDHVTSDILDLDTSQVVQAERQLTRCEVENALAWAQKATTPAQILADYSLDTFPLLKDGDECLGPAWTTHLVPLALQTIKMMGCDGNRIINDFPIRVPANHVALADRCRRLTVLGCIKENPDKEGAYLVTGRGKTMLHLTTKLNLDWGVAWLLMSASAGHLNNTTRLVLVYMAAVLACGPDTLISKFGTIRADGEPYTTADLQKLCAPILAQCASHGMLWLYTGVFLQGLDGTFESSTGTIKPDSYIVMALETAEQIETLAKQEFAPLCNLKLPQNTDWKKTPLSKVQVSSINSALMWAFLHQIVLFQSEVPTPDIRGLPEHIYLAKDCVSLYNFRVDQKKEFLDVKEWVAFGNEHTLGGGFYAIYNQLARRTDQHGNYYIARGLTRLPSTKLQEAEKECGIYWPDLVMRILD